MLHIPSQAILKQVFDSLSGRLSPGETPWQDVPAELKITTLAMVRAEGGGRGFEDSVVSRRIRQFYLTRRQSTIIDKDRGKRRQRRQQRKINSATYVN